MIKKNLKVLIITSIVILLPILAGVILWNKLPEEIPYHWNAVGEVDGWASKPMAVFGTSGLMLVLQWLCVFATSADPKRQNYSQKMLQLVFWLVPALTVVLSIVTYTTALGGNLRVEMILSVFLGLLFIVIGNYLPKCQQNYTVGIKIPWTLASEENWNKTHRVAGFVWVICGALMMLAGFLGLFQFLLVAVLPMVFIPLVYSYILYRKGV